MLSIILGDGQTTTKDSYTHILSFPTGICLSFIGYSNLCATIRFCLFDQSNGSYHLIKY